MLCPEKPFLDRRRALPGSSRRVRALAMLVVIGAAPTIVSCSSSATLSPEQRDNVALMAHFDSLRPTASPDRQGEIGALIIFLAFGAQVQRVTVTVGNPVQYSAVAALEVGDDTAGNPVDSVYELIGWSDDSVHTILELLLADTSVSGEWTSDQGFGFIAAQGAWSVRHTPGVCASLVDRAPPDVSLPSHERCTMATVTVTAPDQTVAIDFPRTGLFNIPTQSVPGIRLDARPRPPEFSFDMAKVRRR